MRVGSLFAGIGGFDLAAERAGMEVVFQSEIDKYASRVLAHHWPEVENLGDIRGIKDAPAVDVLCGGFPCQSYSVAGKRGGLADDRGALWWEYLRLITELRPTWVVGENVPGLLSSRGGRDFETIIRTLTQCGYGVVWAVLDSQYFGVAQRRRRVFIVANLGGVPRPEVLALGEGLFGYPAPSRSERERTASTLAGRTRGGGFPGTGEAIDGAVVAFPWQASWDASQTDGSTPTLPANQSLAVAMNLRGREGGSMPELDDLASLRASAGGSSRSYVVGAQVRRLTPLECERLQGFPDGWTAIPGNSDTQRYRQLGNAVAVPVVEWIMRRIAVASMAGLSEAA